MVDWVALHALWDKWASACVGYSEAVEPLKAALLLSGTLEPSSRQFPLILEEQRTAVRRKKDSSKEEKTTVSEKEPRIHQKGIKLVPTDVRSLIKNVKQNNLQADFFFIGASKYMVTSIHDHWYCARCISQTNPAGEGAIIVRTAAFILVTIYEGSIGAASEAMAATDYLMDKLSRRF